MAYVSSRLKENSMDMILVMVSRQKKGEFSRLDLKISGAINISFKNIANALK